MIRQQHERKLLTQERRNKLRDVLPSLAIRVFALRGTSYKGSGFHYAMEKTVGGLLYRTNNFDEAYSWDNAVIDEVVYEELVEQVTKIEAELASRGNG